MIKYEMLYENSTFERYTFQDQLYKGNIITVLNKLAFEGWELVTKENEASYILRMVMNK